MTKIIAAVANTKWGWKKQYLVRIYSAFIDSKWKYAGFVWLACAAKSHILRLERAQNRALRLMTGQHLATPVETLWVRPPRHRHWDQTHTRQVSGEGGQIDRQSSTKNIHLIHIVFPLQGGHKWAIVSTSRGTDACINMISDFVSPFKGDIN